MKLALCMIVRDNEPIIEECLQSIRPWVDEMIVVDTGSVDRTPEIASALGARIEHFPWSDSFSEARNVSVAAATADWVFWMDSDDVIDADNGQKLRQLVEGQHAPNVLGYVMQVHCPGSGGADAGDVTIVDHIKLFRRLPELRFEGHIHEQILPAIRRAGGDVAWTDIFVTHKYGAVAPAAKARKHTRDLRILERELAEKGEHPFVLFNLGMTYCDMDRPGEARSFLERSIAASGPEESHLRKAYSLLAACCLRAYDYEGAKRACDDGLRRFPEDHELLFRSALWAHSTGRNEEAIAGYERLLEIGDTSLRSTARHFSSSDIGLSSFKARHNLASVLADAGRLSEAEYQLRTAIDDAPAFQPALIALANVMVQQKKIKSAEVQARRWSSSPETHYVGSLLFALVAEARGEHAAAIKAFSSLQESFPERHEHLEGLSRLMFLHERWPAAISALEKMCVLSPDNPANMHNLGAALLANGNPKGAVTWLEKSLVLRPNSASTRQLLRQAIEADGD